MTWPSRFSAAKTVIDGVHEVSSLMVARFATSSLMYFHGIYRNSETIRTK